MGEPPNESTVQSPRSRVAGLWAILFSFFLLLPSASAQLVEPTWNFADFFGNTYGRKQVTITPMELIGPGFTNNLLIGDPRIGFTTNSSFTTNLMNGFAYRVEFNSGFNKYAITNYFGTNVNGAVNGGDPQYLVFSTNLAPGIFAYSMTEANARFMSKMGGAATDPTFTGKITMGANGNVGDVWTKTNADGSGDWEAPTGGGGGNATNIFFYPSPMAIWSQTNGGSNVVTIIGVQPTNANLTDFAQWNTNTYANVISNRTVSGLGSAAFQSSSTFDNAGAATAATNGYPWGSLYDAVGVAHAATNGYPWGALYDSAGLATASTNGWPWGTLYDGAGAATAATNGLAPSSGFLAFVNTNKLLVSQLGAQQYVATDANTNLVGTRDGRSWTNFVTPPASTDTNIVLEKFDGSIIPYSWASLMSAIGSGGPGGGFPALPATNYFNINTNAVLVDCAQAQSFQLCLETNSAIVVFTNVWYLTNYHDRSFTLYTWEDTNGTWKVSNWSVDKGLLRTNSSTWRGTNASQYDALYCKLDGTGTNLIAEWKANWLPGISFTNTLSGGGGGGGGGACDSINDASLTAYWRLDESSGSRSDTGPNSQTLTDSGSTSSGTGILNGDASFSGSTHLSHASSTALQCGAQDFSISLWVKFSSLSGTPVVLGKGAEYFLWVTGGKFEFNSNNGGGPGGHLTSTLSPVINTWYHVVITCTASGDKKMYVNNGSPDSISAGNFTSTSDEFRIGDYVSGGHALSGEVDEVLFTKKILSSTDVSNLYDSGAGCKPSGL